MVAGAPEGTQQWPGVRPEAEKEKGEIASLLLSSHPPVSSQTLLLNKPKQNQGSPRDVFYKDQQSEIQSRASKLMRCSQEQMENDWS